MPVDNNNEVTPNEDDTYLKGKYGIEVYRYNSDTLAIQFKTNSSERIVLSKLNDLGVPTTIYVHGDCESVYFFPEKDIDKVHNVVKFLTKSKNISPKSKRTIKIITKKHGLSKRKRG